MHKKLIEELRSAGENTPYWDSPGGLLFRAADALEAADKRWKALDQWIFEHPHGIECADALDKMDELEKEKP